MQEFVHLHLHTEYSMLDGASRISSLPRICKENNMPACAITDHGNMYGVMKFYKECLHYGIKPIIGCEFYVTDDLTVKNGRQENDHLIVLAKNNTGYKNLMKLNSIAFVDGFYYRPRIDYKTLEKHSKGLIILSACLAGRIPRLLMDNMYDEAKSFAQYLKSIVDEGDFYLELQNHGLQEQLKILPLMKKIAGEIGVKTVATNDVHYIEKEDADIQDIMMCVQMGKYVDEDRLKMPNNQFYLKNYDEMAQALKGYEESLATTLEIAEKCEVYIRARQHADYTKDERMILPTTENFIPYYQNDENIDNYEFLSKLTYEGLQRRYKNITQQIKDRTEMELNTIKDLGFVEYFLVVWDYVHWSQEHDIPVGPGRGSGAGSIVAYSIGITQIEPLRYNLLFERFIHKERVSMPDFDIDFCVDKREKVIDYVKQKYGADHVSLIITFGTMAAKNAIKDVARVTRMPYSQADSIAKLIPLKLPDGIKKPPVLKYYFGLTGDEKNEKFVINELRELYNSNDQIKYVVDMAVKLEGMPRNTSTHAAGVLIAPHCVDEYVPLSRNGDYINTQYDMKELETLGLLKMDFLGLRTLTDIYDAIKFVKKNHNFQIDFDELGYDDPKVFELISSADLDAVFQLESAGFKKFMKNLQPDCLEDIIAGIALYRPGPMDSIPTYIENKKNPSQTVYDDERLKNILSVTYGCIVYQEQVMQIVQVLGGYTLGQADNVRRIMGKKQQEKMVLERQKFIYGQKDENGKELIPGALKIGVKLEVAEKVFSQMEKFAQYAFNKAHAAGYAYIAYQTAYLKKYYCEEYLTAVLNNRISNIDEITRYVMVAKEHNIDVLPPDINKSQTYFSTDGKSIRFGLAGLKNVGVGVIQEIIKERETNGDFKDLMDFVSRVCQQALNKKCLESLILSGAFDIFGKHRSQLMGVYSVALDRANEKKNMIASGQYNMFDKLFVNDQSLDSVDYPDMNEYVPQIKLQYEKEIAGVYLSGHPLEQYMDKFKEFTFNSNMARDDNSMEDEESEQNENSISLNNNDTVTCGGSIGEIKMHTKNNSTMAFCFIEDVYGSFETVLFNRTYEKYKNILKKGNLISIKGRLSLRDGQRPSVVVESIELWGSDKKKSSEEPEEIEVIKQKKLCLRYDLSDKVLHDAILNILKSFEGNDLIYIKNTVDNVTYKLNMGIDCRNSLLHELSTLLSKDDIGVV